MWSYSGDPTSTPLDEVRFLIGDTNSSSQLLSNEEILYNLKMVSGENPPAQGNFLAAAFSADMIASKFVASGNVTSESVGDVSITYAEGRMESFTKLGSSLRRRATFAGVKVYVGGISTEDKAANVNGDIPNLAFVIDGMNNKSPNE